MTYEEVFSQVKKIFMEADVSGKRSIWHSSLILQVKEKALFMLR